MKLKQKETGKTGVMRACLDLLEAERIWYRRWNVGAVKVGGRFFRFGKKGDADILAIVWLYADLLRPVLRPLWIEIKRPGGKITAEQQAFADDVLNHGHLHMFIDDVAVLQKWLIEHRAR